MRLTYIAGLNQNENDEFNRDFATVVERMYQNQDAYYSGNMRREGNKQYIGATTRVENYQIQMNITSEIEEYEKREFKSEVIIGEMASHKMWIMKRNMKNEDTDKDSLMEIVEVGKIDSSNSGGYWEGGIFGEKAMEYGKKFNKMNICKYEGFMKGGKKVCYGREYRRKPNERGERILLYEGQFLNGKRYGKGISYNKRGEVESQGYWLNGKLLKLDDRPKVIAMGGIPLFESNEERREK